MTPEVLQIVQLVFSTIIVPLMGWLLLSVNTLNKNIAASEVWRESHDREIVELRARIAAVEQGLVQVRVELAKLEKTR